MSDIFSDIRDGKAKADIVYKDKWVTAFKDINPETPVHVLIIPNKKFETVNDLETEEDVIYMGHLFLAAKKIAEMFSISESGYRLIMNVNKDGGQEVMYSHMHLLGGLRVGRMVNLPSSCKKKMKKILKERENQN